MNSSPKQERPMSPSELASMFEIPRSLVKLLEEPADTFGPLVPKGDDTVLGAEVIAKALGETLRSSGQKSAFDNPAMSDPSQVVELAVDGYNLVALGKPPAAYPFSVMKKLRKLVLSNNRLRIASPASSSSANSGDDVPDADLQAGIFSLLPELRELQLDHNLLSHFKTATHGKLEMLNLSGNDIHTMDPCSLPRLEFLDLSGNRHLALVTVCKSKWQALVTLDISRCGLDSLQPLAGATALQQHLRCLNVSRNELTSLQGIESLPGLEFIDASHNKIKHSRIVVGTRGHNVNPLTSCASSLQELHLQDNNISTLAFFPAATPMKKLWKLLLSGNPLGGKQDESAAAAKGDKENEQDTSNSTVADDDIGDAEYDDDSNNNGGAGKQGGAKLGTVMVQRGNIKASGAAGSSSTKAASSSSTVVKRKAQQSNSNNNASARSSSTQPDQSKQQQQQQTNRGFAAKLAAMCPQCEVLDLGHTGVVTTKAELEAVCRELSHGCIYLRELDLPLPLSANGDAEQRTADANSATKPGAATLEESALIDFVVGQMSYLARFNGYVVRDESQISVAEEARKVAHRQQLGSALEELKELEHLVDADTMKMLRDFTVEANELEAGIAEREKNKMRLLQQQQQHDQGAQDDDDDDPFAGGGGGGGGTSARPSSRPGSAAKSSIPKQRPVVRTSALSKQLDAQAQKERDSAKTEFEAMLDEIHSSRHSIEATLEHVAGSMVELGVAAPRSGSPFSEVDEFQRKQREKEQKRLEKEQQQLNRELLRDKLAAKAEPVANAPHPPPQSKAAATNAKLAEKFTDEAAKLREKMAQSEKHVRSAVYPSATPFSSSSVTGRSSALAMSASNASVTTTRSSIGGAAAAAASTPPPAKSSPLGQRRGAGGKNVAGLVDSSSDDDDGSAPPSAVKSTRGPGQSSSLAKEVAEAAKQSSKTQQQKPEPQARVSKWSNEKKEPLSVRLARIAEQYNAGDSAREEPLSSSPPQSAKAVRTSGPAPDKARPASAGATSASPQQQQQQQQQQRVASAGTSNPGVAVQPRAQQQPVQAQQAHHQAPPPQQKVTFTSSSLNVRRK